MLFKVAFATMMTMALAFGSVPEDKGVFWPGDKQKDEATEPTRGSRSGGGHCDQVNARHSCRTHAYGSDGDCDDGGPGADYCFCQYGTDPFDCGAREAIEQSLSERAQAAAAAAAAAAWDTFTTNDVVAQFAALTGMTTQPEHCYCYGMSDDELVARKDEDPPYKTAKDKGWFPIAHEVTAPSCGASTVLHFTHAPGYTERYTEFHRCCCPWGYPCFRYGGCARGQAYSADGGRDNDPSPTGGFHGLEGSKWRPLQVR